MGRAALYGPGHGGGTAGGRPGSHSRPRGLRIESYCSSPLQSLTSSILERGTAEQLLHGEPHPGNVLSTKRGLLFVDLESAAVGPLSSMSRTR